jgi:hypothetical protein
MSKKKFFIKFKDFIYFGRRVDLFISKGPRFHYDFCRWKIKVWLQRISKKNYYFDNIKILKQIDLKQQNLKRIKEYLFKDNFEDALTCIASHLRTKNDPKFYFTLDDRKILTSLVPKRQKEFTIKNADKICENIFYLRREHPIKFEDSVDWNYCPGFNVDFNWDLNRHAYFETLGRAYWYSNNERYAFKFREILIDWINKNPATVNNPNWESAFEVAFRINVWIWAFYYFRNSEIFDEKTCLVFLKGLLAHGYYIDTNIEFHVPNNHLLLEAKALVMLGIILSEFKLSKKWREHGLKILYRQIKMQVCSDGVHGERSSHYHRVITGELLELFVLMQNNNIDVPQEITDIFARMLEFELSITKPNGSIPLLSDAALEDTYFRFHAIVAGPIFLKRNNFKSTKQPIDEASIWLLGHKRIKEYFKSSPEAFIHKSKAFPEGGYYIMRDGKNFNEAYMVFDCGDFGYKQAPGHGHADALSIEMHSFGTTMIVDPGIYSVFKGKKWRNFFRSSYAHNTVVVDNKNQSILLDTQRVFRPARSIQIQWFSSEHIDFVDGFHDGYKRIVEPIIHRRQICFIKPQYWVIFDLLIGRGKHCFDLLFHLMPETETTLNSESGYVFAKYKQGPSLSIIPISSNNFEADIIAGAVKPIQGWVSFFSGEKIAAPTLRYRLDCKAPLSFSTVICPYPLWETKKATASSLDITIGENWLKNENLLTGIQINTEKYIDYLVVDRSISLVRKTFKGYETNAQIIYLRLKKNNGRLVKAVMKGGNQFQYHGKSLLNNKNHNRNFIFNYIS